MITLAIFSALFGRYCFTLCVVFSSAERLLKIWLDFSDLVLRHFCSPFPRHIFSSAKRFLLFYLTVFSLFWDFLSRLWFWPLLFYPKGFLSFSIISSSNTISFPYLFHLCLRFFLLSVHFGFLWILLLYLQIIWKKTGHLINLSNIRLVGLRNSVSIN